MKLPSIIAATACVTLPLQAATILTDTFDANGNVNGSITGWTETGTNLYGGVGTESNAAYPTASGWAYFQINQTNNAGMYRSTGVTGLTGQTITLTFDLGGKNNVQVYNGAFTASIWDGTPGAAGSTQLTSTTPANPAAGAFTSVSLATTLTANTTENLFVQFNAGNAPTNDFRQALIDNVRVTQVPEPSATTLLGSVGLLTLLRRRR